MPRFVPDSSCIVAALSSWHEQHTQAMQEMDRRLDAGATLVVAAPTLIEAYSVLTRWPPPRRLSPENTFALLRSRFASDDIEVIALESHEYRRLLGRIAHEGVAGGQVYDAIILACAIAARADVLLTFNERHFRSLAPNSIEIVVPGQ